MAVRSQPLRCFRAFSHRGTWANAGLCNTCERSLASLVEPLLVQWDEGSEIIGDFSYCAYTVVVKPTVVDFLKENAFEFEYRRTAVVPPNPEVPRIPRVAYPYEGSTLHWVVPRILLPLDAARSGVGIESSCSACGYTRWRFAREGIVIDSAVWAGEKVFRIEHFAPSGAIVITEEGLSILRGTSFSGLGYHECGEIE